MHKSLPYEVIRDRQGTVAISVNLGLLPKEPDIYISGRDIKATGGGYFEDVPADALRAARSRDGLLIVEMAVQGVVREHVCYDF